MEGPIKTNEIPTGKYCQVVKSFSRGTQCAELDDSAVMYPKCLKFKERLDWNISGRIRRCKACVEESHGRES